MVAMAPEIAANVWMQGLAEALADCILKSPEV
jgi:hypothetical protein